MAVYSILEELAESMTPAKINMNPKVRVPIICRMVSSTLADAGDYPVTLDYLQTIIEGYLKKGYNLAAYAEPEMRGPLHEMLDECEMQSAMEMKRLDREQAKRLVKEQVIETGEPYHAMIPCERKGRSGAVYSFDGRAQGKPYVTFDRQITKEDVESIYAMSRDCCEDISVVIPELCSGSIIEFAQKLGIELCLP